MRRHVRCRTVTARDRKLWCGLIRSLDGVPFRRVAHAKDLSTVSLEVPDETFASAIMYRQNRLGNNPGRGDGIEVGKIHDRETHTRRQDR